MAASCRATSQKCKTPMCTCQRGPNTRRMVGQTDIQQHEHRTRPSQRGLHHRSVNGSQAALELDRVSNILNTKKKKREVRNNEKGYQSVGVNELWTCRLCADKMSGNDNQKIDQKKRGASGLSARLCGAGGKAFTPPGSKRLLSWS